MMRHKLKFSALLLSLFALSASSTAAQSLLGSGLGYPNLLIANISASSNFLTVNGFPVGANGPQPLRNNR